MSRSQRRRGRGALCERGASVCTESEGQERLDREQVARDGVRWPVAVFHIYRYETGIWGFIDSFRVVLVCGMRKWYASS